MPAEKTFRQQILQSAEARELTGKMEPFGDASSGVITPITRVIMDNTSLPSFEPDIRHPDIRLINLTVDNKRELSTLSLANQRDLIDPDILEKAKKSQTPVFIRVSVPDSQDDKLYVYGDKLGTGQWAFNLVSNPFGEVRAHAHTLFLSGDTTIKSNDPNLTPDLVDAVEACHKNFKDRPAEKFGSRFLMNVPKDLFSSLRNNFTGTVSSLSAILIPKTNTAEWAGGLFILPALNNLQILFTTSLELALRTASAAMTKDITKFYDKIKLADKNMNGERLFGNTLVNGLLMAALSIPWCLAQTVSLAADVLSYTRQFLDSASHMLNPGWWACKGYEAITGNRTNTPSAGIVAKTLLSSTLKLLPAAGAIALVALTAGFATPLAAVGSTLGSVFLGGATSLISKVLAASERLIDKKINIGDKITSFFKSKPESGREEEMEMQSAPTKSTAHSSTAQICDRKHLTIEDPHFAPLKEETPAPTETKTHSTAETVSQRKTLSTPLLPKEKQSSDDEGDSRRRRPGA